MKPISSDALKRMALAHGAKLEVSGKNVNAARLQVTTRAPEPVARKVEATTAPAVEKPVAAPPDTSVREAVQSIDNYAASQFLINDSNAALMRSIKEMLQKPADQPADKKPVEWVFKVNRDQHGFMDTITAKAKYA